MLPALAAAVSLVLLAAAALGQAAFPVAVAVDLNDKLGPWKPVHRFYGCDEPNYAYAPAGQRLLAELGKTSNEPVYFRTHNLLTTGDGTPALKWGSTNVYTEAADGTPVYDYAILDRILDSYHAGGVRPYFQLGFMPEALSSKPQPYRHTWDPKQPYDAIYTGWTHPPKDWAKWEELCFQVVRHCVEKYGKEEVEKWYFQVWNEANIPYWKGTRQEFFKLHDLGIKGVRRALPTARVGGPDFAGDGGAWMDEFLDYCKTNNVPLDFVSFHAKGEPRVIDGHVRMGIAEHLRNLDRAFGRFASRPEVKNVPIVIGESDPEGCAACQGPQLAYRNGTVYSSYTAASFARKLELADKYGVNLEGVLTWAFLFDGEPAFAGFRVLASGEVDHPVMNAFRLFGELAGDRARVRSSGAVPLDPMLKGGVRGDPDVSALATVGPGRAAVLAWHYHDDDVAGPPAEVTVELKGVPATARRVRWSEQRIDGTAGNAFAAWQAMGRPPRPTAEQTAELQRAAKLVVVERGELARGADGAVRLPLALPRQAVALAVVEWDE